MPGTRTYRVGLSVGSFRHASAAPRRRRMPQLSIGEVAQKTGVTVETVRYYEYLGLLPAVARTQGGSRRYSPDIIPHLQFIKHAQALGLSLRDIQTMTRRTSDDRETCRQVHSILTRQLDYVNERLAELTASRQVLTDYLSACEQMLREPDATTCPVLAPLAPCSSCACPPTPR
jgi:DNA-binding transcriptional MerR regulator